MKSLIILTLLVGSLFASDIDWSNNYKKTLDKAKLSGKSIYILITSDNCRWCRKFESTTLQDKVILKRLYKEFEVLHLSRDRDVIPDKFEVTPVPRHYFVTSDEEILYNSLGHRGVDCFDAFMDNAQNKLKVTK